MILSVVWLSCWCLRVRRGRLACPRFLTAGPQWSPGSRADPQGRRAQRDAEHPWGRRGGPV